MTLSNSGLEQTLRALRLYGMTATLQAPCTAGGQA